MLEKKVGGIDIAIAGNGAGGKRNSDPYIIALFGEENSGKTRFCMTAKELIGCVPLEMKAYKTLDMASKEMGKRIVHPVNPLDLIVNARVVQAIEKEVDQQQFYIKHLGKVQDYIYALLEHPDVETVMIDKFTTLATWIKYAVQGMEQKMRKIGDKVFQDNREVNQTIIDFLNSLSQYGKTVILTNASKDDYDVKGPDGKPMRKTWESFKYLGSHCNLVVELVDNKFWDVRKSGEKHDWHYGLSVRRCQDQPGLEGPDGQLMLKDDGISLAQLIAVVDPNADLDRYM